MKDYFPPKLSSKEQMPRKPSVSVSHNGCHQKAGEADHTMVMHLLTHAPHWTGFASDLDDSTAHYMVSRQFNNHMHNEAIKKVSR